MFVFEEKTLQRLEELIGLIEKYIGNRNLNRQFAQESWDYITVLCREMKNLIPETMKRVGHGISLGEFKGSIDFGKLRTELLKIVSNWRTTSQMNEKQMIIDALNKANQNDKKAAKLLGISRRTLLKKVKEYNLQSSTFPIPDLNDFSSDLTHRYFMIQPEVEGSFYFQRDNSFLWMGNQAITGRELCISGHPYMFYHREIVEWLSGLVPHLIDTTSVALRDDENRFVPDHYFEIVAKPIVGFIELPVVDLPEVFRIQRHANCVFFHSNLLGSFRARFPAASATFRLPSLIM